MYNIFRYIVSLTFVLLCSNYLVSQTLETDSIVVPLWQGIELETDVVPLISNLLNDDKTFRYEVLSRVNLKNKYFPVVEVGYEGKHRELGSGIDFTGTGMFYRVGLDFNLLKSMSTQAVKNKFLLGARLGYSNFFYDISNISYIDEYKGADITGNIIGLQSKSLWFEIVGGIRIEILKNVSVGWSVRIKNQLGEPEAGAIIPWYIPGFGQTGSSVWAFNYMIGYKF
ncbi:MAG: DUF6048 family protein [Paludibacter sp.]|nr:DUF6048 family protein [Paludibacter sp.]